MISGAQPVPLHLSELGHKHVVTLFAHRFFSDVSSNSLSNDKDISQRISEVAALAARSERGLNTKSPT